MSELEIFCISSEAMESIAFIHPFIHSFSIYCAHKMSKRSDMVLAVIKFTCMGKSHYKKNYNKVARWDGIGIDYKGKQTGLRVWEVLLQQVALKMKE